MFAAESIGYLVSCLGLVLKDKSEFLQVGNPFGMSSIPLPLLVEVPESFMIRALEGHRDQGDREIKVDVPDFHDRLHPEDFLDWLSRVEKFFDWKELSEVCEDEIPEHWPCQHFVGSSPSKA